MDMGITAVPARGGAGRGVCRGAEAAHADEPLQRAAHTWLDLARRKLDESVFSAYGWNPALSDDDLLAKLLDLDLQRVRSG